MTKFKDQDLRETVTQELDWEPSIDSSDIGVAVEDGIVTLTGHVPTYDQKLTAENVAKRVRGVHAIVQKVEVRPAFSDGDEGIARRALNVLEWNTSVPADSVKLKVAKGYVTLSGEVEWQYQRTAAEEAVRRLGGVIGVINQITLKSRVQAGDIKKRIEDALERQAELDARSIRVNVQGGKVVLEGKVRAWFERDAAERAVWSAPGVNTVEDRVTVGI